MSDLGWDRAPSQESQGGDSRCLFSIPPLTSRVTLDRRSIPKDFSSYHRTHLGWFHPVPWMTFVKLFLFSLGLNTQQQCQAGAVSRVCQGAAVCAWWGLTH